MSHSTEHIPPDTVVTEGSDTSGVEPVRSGPAWFHFRLRTLLIIPAALLIIAAVFGPRQLAQKNALVAIREMQGIVRTEPVALPLVRELAGDDYAQQILEVYLRNPAIQDDNLKPLAGLSGLQKLELVGSSVTNEGLKHLQGLDDLYILHLSSTKVGDEGLKSLQGLSNLGVLSLNSTPVSDEGMQYLSGLPRLERLFLDDTAISDAGLQHIGKITTLKELTLIRTKISDAGLDHLKTLKDLEVLKLGETAVTSPAAAKLKSALPACYIEDATSGAAGQGM